jgi:chemotaxis protein methyltransferase CheR
MNFVIDFNSVALTNKEFERIRDMLYQLCGINLSPGKEGLVKSRLMKRLRKLSLDSFDAYLEYLENDKSGQELTTMVDLLTTNKTNFFRENEHFKYLKSQVLPPLLSQQREIRIWSAGCSSGEEPYTTAIVLHESIPLMGKYDVRILATDISTNILAKAKNGVYDQDTLQDIEPSLVKKYFSPHSSGGEILYKVKDHLRSLIRFARLNLMESWPMKGPFDVIFCRNVMIYFDKPTQRQLVNRFHQMLRPGGFLFIGHSESLTNTSTEFQYVQPATYRKAPSVTTKFSQLKQTSI